MKIYTFHIDPGHGWVEVPYSELVELGIQDTISKYSYRDGNTCYLEEDCDAGRWEDAYTAKYGKPVYSDKHHDDSCFIRDLLHYWNFF